jgi:hypothetical protein
MNFASSISQIEQLIKHGPIHCHFNKVTTWLLRALVNFVNSSRQFFFTYRSFLKKNAISDWGAEGPIRRLPLLPQCEVSANCSTFIDNSVLGEYLAGNFRKLLYQHSNGG